MSSNGETAPPINLDTRGHETILEAAIDYTRGGVRVTPLNGKKPILAEWNSKFLEQEDLPSHFDNGQNLGVILGEPSRGLVDVDLDTAHAVAAADELMPKTLVYGRERNPRSHRLYVSNPPPKSATYSLTKAMRHYLGLTAEDRGVLVELRSTGRQSALPPSVHSQDGDEYVWEPGDELLELDGRTLAERVKALATASLLSKFVDKGNRQHFYLHAAGFLGRHMDHERVEAILKAVVVITGDEEPEKRVQAVRDTLEKLRNGERVTGGPALEVLAPGVPALVKKWWGWKENGAASKEKKSIPTHDELRDRLLEKNPNMVFGLGEWHQYDQGTWAPISQLTVEREIVGCLEAAKPEGVRPTAALLASVERLARAKAAIPEGVWDDGDILVCTNGTLEISTATLREHRPKDFALSSVPYGYDPQATAPTWDLYLNSTIPDAAGFLQEFAGYALTPETLHELAVWLYGPPGTGKSTFIEGLKAMLGARAGVLGLADVQRNRFALASLPGKTLVVAAEQPSDFINSTHIINAIISGEEIPVEKKFKDAYLITPKAKICWAMNDLPRVADANNGLFRRVKVVSFPKLEAEPDPEIKRKIKSEGAGILNWALQGLQRLRERGKFEIPSCVHEATEDFQKTNDVPALFVEEACLIDEAAKVQASKLYEAYTHWCKTNGHKPRSSTSISSDWVRLGCEKKTLNGRTFYHGLEVDPKWIAEQGEDYPKG